ncbi:MAG: hemin uptake protein HemP [Planctomyces sp.]|nr:hemin uptake protein HemP [Planctomyces sp.]
MDPDKPNQTPDSSPTHRHDDANPEPVIRSSSLFAGHREVQIEHDGVTYRLRITRSGKLILTK